MNQGELSMSEASSPDLVNAVISALDASPDLTTVASTYDNCKNPPSQVQAYAKIAGSTWTYYVKSLTVSLGRNTEQPPPSAIQTPTSSIYVDIDLGPAKVVSRNHALIVYNLDQRCWELRVHGRNGARVDGSKAPIGPGTNTVLHSGAILDIGGTQMMFILPDTPAYVLPRVLPRYLEKINQIQNSPYNHHLRQGSIPPQQQNLPFPYPPPDSSNPTSHHRQTSSTSSATAPRIFIPKNASSASSNSLVHTINDAAASSLQTNLDEDLSRDEARNSKPPYSYATMITQAILSNPYGVLLLLEIYQWIASHYSYYRFSKSGWQNLIRHNLSLNKAFEKVPRKPDEPGKGMKWQISAKFKQEFMERIDQGPSAKSRRGSSVSRQLQLHLATHKQLPDSQRAPGEQLMGHYQRPSQPQNHAAPFHHEPMNLPPPQAQSGGSQTDTSGYYQYPLPLAAPKPNAIYGGDGPGYAYPSPHNPAPAHQIPMPGPLGPQPLGPQPLSELASPMRPHSKPQLHRPSFGFVPPPLINLHPPALPQKSTNLPTLALNRANSVPGPAEEKEVNTLAVLDLQRRRLFPDECSPQKPSAVEVATPDRRAGQGSRLTGVNGQPPQSSPAFWNFVLFSTPNGALPLRNGSPDLGRKQLSPPDLVDTPSQPRSLASQRSALRDSPVANKSHPVTSL